MYALYAHREGMTNIFIRTFNMLCEMDDVTIEAGSGPDPSRAGFINYHSFPEGYEAFALNLSSGELNHFTDGWALVQDEELRQDFFCSFSCFA